MNREFKGVWIPKKLYLEKGLTWTDKLIILEVHSFSNNGLECFVSNEHLAEFTQASLSSVEKSISKLVKQGIIVRTKKKIEGSYQRFLRVANSNFCEDEAVNSAIGHPYILRPTNINIQKQINKPKRERTPVNNMVVIHAFVEAGSTEKEANKFYDYYESNGWKQGKGKPIINWKAAARNWIRRSEEFKKNNNANGFDRTKISGERLRNYFNEGNS
tara:strand:- start:1908 stop:2555 length:648 start_codon:yes stop_codon:yes gene_type:complete